MSSITNPDMIPHFKNSSPRDRRKTISTRSNSAAKTKLSTTSESNQDNASGNRTKRERAGFAIVLGAREDVHSEGSEPLQHNSPAAGCSAHESSNSSPNDDHMAVDDIAPLQKHHSVDGNSCAKSRIPRILKGLHNEDIIATPRKLRDEKQRFESGSSPRSSPKAKRTRLTRNDIKPRTVSYDSKFHPMDTNTRPNASATRRGLINAVRLLEEKTDHGEVDKSQPPTTKKTRATRQLRNDAAPNYDITVYPLNAVLKSDGSSTRSLRSEENKTPSVEKALDFAAADVATEWAKLSEFDKRLYTLQGGAPEDSNYLSMKWSEVARTLVQDGFLTKSHLINQRGKSELKERYTVVRRAIQGELADVEAKTKNNLPLYWLEDFDVYDMKADAEEQYVHKNIPEYMQGIENFTSVDLLRMEQEFKTCRRSLPKIGKNDADHNSSPVHEELEVNATNKPPLSVAFQRTTVARISNRGTSKEWNSPSEISLGTDSFQDLRESLGPSSEGPQLNTEEVNYIAVEQSNQETPANNLLSRRPSKLASEYDLRSSPSGVGIFMTRKNVAPVANMVAPLNTAELTTAALGAMFDCCQRREEVAANCSNSHELAEQFRISDIKGNGPSMLELHSNDGLPLNNPDKQLLPLLSMETEIVKRGKDSTIRSLRGLSTKSIESQIIVGTTRRQLDRTKRAKKTKNVTLKITIHEDIPGTTPKASRHRPHNSAANDMPKENDNTDEHEEDVTIGRLLNAVGARRPAAQLRDPIGNTGNRRQPRHESLPPGL